MISHHIDSYNMTFTMPEEWGNPTSVVDKVNGYSLQDLWWENFSRWIKSINASHKDIGNIDDQTNGFDYNSISLCIMASEKSTIEAAVVVVKMYMDKAYMEIPYRFRKRAKENTTPT